MLLTVAVSLIACNSADSSTSAPTTAGGAGALHDGDFAGTGVRLTVKAGRIATGTVAVKCKIGSKSYTDSNNSLGAADVVAGAFRLNVGPKVEFTGKFVSDTLATGTYDYQPESAATACKGVAWEAKRLCYGPKSSQSGWLEVAAGASHSCGIRADGTAHCWGVPDAFSKVPTGSYIQVSCGGSLTCWLDAQGAAICTGATKYDGDLASPHAGPYARVVAGQGGVGKKAACGLRGDGQLQCWGNNDTGLLEVPAGPFTAAAVGSGFACALRADASVTCWGKTYKRTIDTPTGTFAAMAAAPSHACGIRTDGSIACWGHCIDIDKAQPWCQPPTGDFAQISTAGDSQSGTVACALRKDGTIVCWGASANPTLETPVGQFAATSVGGHHACARAVDGYVHCWGSNVSSRACPP